MILTYNRHHKQQEYILIGFSFSLKKLKSNCLYHKFTLRFFFETDYLLNIYNVIN